MDSTPPPYNRRAKSRASPMALQDLLQLPSSPLRRSAKARLDLPDDAGASSRRRLKACPSPRNARRSRRRSEPDEKDSPADDLPVVSAKPRKRRHSVARSNKDKLALIPFSSPSPKMKEEEIQVSLDRICQGLEDLVMWTDVSRSSLWFGLGSLFFFSSCFTHGVHFSAFSVISKIGLLFLAVSFFSNTMRQRNGIECKREYGVKEEDLLRIARLVLPFANVAMSKTRGLFSGDPSTTLKVAPMLLLGSEYGHVITLWRLCAIVFFYVFTVPKIYSFYSVQISQKVTQLGWRAFEAWGSCHHKKVVAASAVTAFWNLSTVKTRIFTAFMCLVLIRYCREHISQEIQDDKEAVAEEQDDDKEAVAEEQDDDDKEAVAEEQKGEEKNSPPLQNQDLVLDCPNKQQTLD